MTGKDLEFQPTAEDLKILREWLKKMPHLVQDYDDEFLAAFVRGSKGSLQKTKMYLENFNALGLRYPHFFGHLNIFDPITQEHLNNTLVFPWPKKTKNNSTVIVIKLNPSKVVDPYHFHICETIRVWLMFTFLTFWENDAGESKIILLVDWENFKIAHGREITPTFMKSALEILETSLPARVQGLHYINLPPVFEWVITLFKSLAKKKLADRIMIHSSLKTVHEKISREILPKEFGGDEEDLVTLHEQFKKKLESYSDRFIEEQAEPARLQDFGTACQSLAASGGSLAALARVQLGSLRSRKCSSVSRPRFSLPNLAAL